MYNVFTYIEIECVITCDICGKECKSKSGLGQHLALMHSFNSPELREERAKRQRGIHPPSKGMTKNELPYLARPSQIGKQFGSSLIGSHTEETKKKIS